MGMAFSAGVLLFAWKLPLRQKIAYCLIAIGPWVFLGLG